MFSTIDTNYVLLLNQLANSSQFWQSISYFLSSYLIFLLPLIPALRMISVKDKTDRIHELRVFAWAVAAVICSLAAGYLFEGAIGRHRPYQALSEIATIGRLPGNSSFPSMHSLIVFAFSISYVLREKYYQMGLLLFLLGLLVGAGRILCGFHYPTDIFGGFVIGTFSAFVLVYEGSPLLKWVSKRPQN